MDKYNHKPPLSGRLNPFLGLLSVVLLTIGFYIVGNLLGTLVVVTVLDLDINALVSILTGANAVNDELRTGLYILQGFSSFFAFIFAPYFYVKVIEKSSISVLYQSYRVTFLAMFLTFIITISFMPVNSWIIEWNMNVDFPDFMEKFAREKEDEARLITEALTEINTTTQLMMAVLVIVLIPAVGEELLFRGLIQTKLWEAGKNIHLAIWVTGIIFGLIHMQFYGLVPRILLGVLFGYLYYWSGTLWMPILAHFINNGLTLLGLYLYNTGALQYDIENQDVPVGIVIPFFVILVSAIFYFKKYMDQKRQHESMA